MSKSKAKKYARALFETCSHDEYEKKVSILNELSRLWESDQEMVIFFNNPAVQQQEKESVVTEIAKFCDAEDPKLKNFLLILLEKSYLDMLPDIAEAFEDLYDNFRDSLKLIVTTAHELDQPEQESILSYLKGNFGKLVSIEWQTDSELIGGFKVQSGDNLLDSSVSGALEKIKTNLLTKG